MKKLITLCTACLLALSGCNGETSTTPSPELSEAPVTTSLTVETPAPTTEAPDDTPLPTDTVSLEVPPTETLPLPTSTPFLWDGDPDSLTLNDFPTQLSSGEQVLEAVTALGPDDAGLYLVCQIPDQDTWLYAAYGPGDKQGLILRVGTEWRYYSIPFLSEQAHMPAMAYGDFDGDQNQELAVVPYLGGSTGTNTWGLYMGWTSTPAAGRSSSSPLVTMRRFCLCLYPAAMMRMPTPSPSLPVTPSSLWM